MNKTEKDVAKEPWISQAYLSKFESGKEKCKNQRKNRQII